MMNDFSLREQSSEDFLLEALELLQTLEQGLLTLKTDRSPNTIYSLMRAIHTLKGMAASIGLTTLEQMTHFLEDVFNALYNPAIVIDSDLETLLFQSYEYLSLLLTPEWTPSSIDEASISNQITAVFAQLQEKLGDSLGRPLHLPTSAALKFDIPRSIFETVVEKDLAHLTAALEHPIPEQVAIIFRQKATIFLGLAEGLSLPGFAAIAQATIDALSAHPDQAVVIARIALADFQRGKAQILAGDRTRGGEPSTMLQQFVISRMRGAIIKAPQANPSNAVSQPNTGSLKVPPPRTIRVDLERLNRLKHLTGNLLANQTQQGTAKERLQDTLDQFRENVQQHQQTLNKIRETLNQIRDRPKVNSDSPTEARINPLMQTALEESAQLEEALGEVAFVHEQLSQALEQQQQLVTHIRADLTDVQMASLAAVFDRLQAALQRLVTVHDKPAELKISGTPLLIEKVIAEKLYEPLLHLVRNAFDHGLEFPVDRQFQGKPATGQIHIRAYEQEHRVVIEIQDDGRGLDFPQIQERAVQRGWLLPTDIENLSACQIQERLQELLFEPGFSTTTQVSELSGRGIGLNVVRSQIEALQGSIAVQSRPQQGTTFVLQIPTLTTPPKLPTIKPETQDYLVELEHSPGDDLPAPSLEEIWGQVPFVNHLEDAPAVVSPSTPENSSPLSSQRLKVTEFFSWMANSVIFVLSYNQIEEFLTPKPDQVIQSRNQRFLHWRDHMMRVYPLSDLLNNSEFLLGTAPRSNPVTSILNILIVRQGQQVIALESDLKRLITEPNLLIQAPDDPATPGYLWGYTRLENGALFPVVDVAALLDWTLGDRRPREYVPTQPRVARDLSSPAVANKNNALVIDDSAAMRRLLSTALEEVGYRVLQAQDGQEAIEYLQKDFRVHLIICDIEMPRVNGLEFLRWYFQNSSIVKVPVVMLSNWDREEYRQKAMEWGAVAYFTKPYNKPKFLATLQTIGAASRPD